MADHVRKQIREAAAGLLETLELAHVHDQAARERGLERRHLETHLGRLGRAGQARESFAHDDQVMN